MSGSSEGSDDPSARWSDEVIISQVQDYAKNNSKREARNAFEQLYLRHADRILHLILFLLKSPQASKVAEDLREDTFMNAFDVLVIKQKPLSFNEPGKVRAWLNVIAYNEVRQYWRQTKQDVSLDTSEEGRGESAIEAAASMEMPPFTDDVERRIAIEETKSKLSPRDSKIIELSFEQDMDIRQVAEILDMEVDTARQARLRAAERFVKLYNGPLPSTQGQPNDSPGVSLKPRNARKKAGRSDE